MLLRQHVLDGIRAGTITLAFRRWQRPTVRTGGTLLTAAGQLRIGDVAVVTRATITTAEAARAGYASLADLLAFLDERDDGAIYRIEFAGLAADPRVALRATVPANADDEQTLIATLRRIDQRAPAGPWTVRVLALLRDRPAVRAGDLCLAVGQERLVFKGNVRKLKALGLTESLEVGYRLSPRGQALLATLER